MNIKNLLRYSKLLHEPVLYFQEDACYILSKHGFCMIGEIDKDSPVGAVQDADAILEAFGKRNIISVDAGGFHGRDLDVEMPAVELPSLHLEPTTSWTRDIAKWDFLGRTTHIKAGMEGFCRGKIYEDGTWGAAGADAFDGLIYEAYLVNEILRDSVDINKVTLCDFVDDPSVTPLFVTAGDYRVLLPRCIL